MKKDVKVLLVLLSLLFFVGSVSGEDLSVSPYGINVEYNLTEDQPESIELTFVNNDNDSFEKSISIEGDAAGFLSLSKNNLSFSGGSMDTTTLSFDIDSSQGLGLVFGKVVFDDQYIPVYIQVNRLEEESDSNCRIISTYSAYTYNRRKGTEPNSQDFYFKISSDCQGSIEITDIRLDGGIDTEEGKQPLRFSGGIPKGVYEAGDSFLVTLEIDVSELSPQTYEESLLIAGLTGDESVRTKIDFEVNVFGIKSSFSSISNIESPVFDPIPDVYIVNQSYAIVARNVNPNLDIIFEPNGFIRGQAPTMDEDTWIYRFTPIKRGETEFKIYASHKGGVVGTPIIKNVKINTNVAGSIGTDLRIHFFQDLTSLTDGQEVSFLIKDNSSDIIISDGVYSSYLNGKKITGNSFFVVAGETYTLSISAEGFKSVEETFTANEKIISISITPEIPLINDTVSVNTAANATINVNGVLISGKTFIVENSGTYDIQVSKEGFKPNSLNFTVEIALSLMKKPSSNSTILVNDVLHFQFNRPAEWVIEREEAKGEIPTTYLQGGYDSFDFTPSEPGKYYLITGGAVVWESDYIEKGFFSGIGTAWVWWVLVIGLLALAYWKRDFLTGMLKGKPKTNPLEYQM